MNVLTAIDSCAVRPRRGVHGWPELSSGDDPYHSVGHGIVTVRQFVVRDVPLSPDLARTTRLGRANRFAATCCFAVVAQRANRHLGAFGLLGAAASAPRRRSLMLG